MASLSRRTFLATGVAAGIGARIENAQTRSIDDFFRDFTGDWVKRDRIQRARLGIADLRGFNRAGLTEAQRISADLMECLERRSAISFH